MNTATVEALTAEVRVLMVANRQITLSVARQLDRMEWPAVDEATNFAPFGRVRTGTKVIAQRKLKVKPSRVTDRHWDNYPHGWIEEYDTDPWAELIGRRIDDGSLVLFVASWDSSKEEWAVRERAVIAEWKELPLIVLAGLR